MSERVLEQQEVDRLVKGIRSGDIATSPGSLAPLQSAAPVDLSDPSWSHERILRRKLPVLEQVFNRLAPFAQVTLTKSLRFPIRAEFLGVELLKFGDFRSRLEGRPLLFQVIHLDPLRGYSVVIFDSTILYALIDALMGGLEVADSPPDRDVSGIEASLLQKSHDDMLRDLENSWKPWFPLQVEAVRSDRSVHMLSTIPDQEICHIATINVAGDVLPASPLYFVMPYTSLEPLFDATSARVGEEIDPNWRMNLEKNLCDTEISLAAHLGDALLPTSRVRSLAPGEIIELDRGIGEDIDMEIEGEHIFTGRIGKSNLNYGVSITSRREMKRTFIDRSIGQILVRKGTITREQLAVATVDELINRKPVIDSIIARGWAERSAVQAALQ